MRTLIIGDCVIRIFDDDKYLETNLPDGTKVPAIPNYDDASIKLAYELGFGGDTWAMSRDHEITQTQEAVDIGLRYSPTLWRVAHPLDPNNISNHGVALEEAKVLERQRRKNAAIKFSHG